MAVDDHDQESLLARLDEVDSDEMLDSDEKAAQRKLALSTFVRSHPLRSPSARLSPYGPYA